MTEIELMKSLDHKNIIKLDETLFTKNNVYMILDYADNGDLE
jgi:serine/threonine protein kinase